MRSILVTGGTVFVSRYAAAYFRDRGWQVYVLNRNSRPQEKGVTLIEADRHALGDTLRGMHFDAVADITAYNDDDVNDLLDALDSFGTYVMISSSAVYPDTGRQPFTEKSPVGPNSVWGAYGTDKIAAEAVLQARVPDAYILRPPYIYGPMNNVYREAFVFDCAMAERPFRVPETDLPLQFFHVRDLCRMMEAMISLQPERHVWNVGNAHTVTAEEWAEMCYRAAGKPFEAVRVPDEVPVRSYFSFHPYAYELDVTAQEEILPETIPLGIGLCDAFAWYQAHSWEIKRKPYIEFIDRNGL